MIFRRDPIPGTGRKGWHWCDFYKYPKSHQERRQAVSFPDCVRPRRSWKNLPDAWEDVPRGDAGDHSWKRNKKRRKQWMR